MKYKVKAPKNPTHRKGFLLCLWMSHCSGPAAIQPVPVWGECCCIRDASETQWLTRCHCPVKRLPTASLGTSQLWASPFQSVISGEGFSLPPPHLPLNHQLALGAQKKSGLHPTPSYPG